MKRSKGNATNIKAKWRALLRTRADNAGERAPEELKIKVGSVLILGDVHANFVSPEVIKRARSFAFAHKIKTLVLAGDVVNADAFSSHPAKQRRESIGDEIEQCKALFNYFDDVFSAIYWITGNHDRRISTLTFGELNIYQLADMVCGAVRRKVKVTPYSRLWIESGGQLWLVAHQKNYSKVKLSVARALASKYECNVICAHQHLCAVGASDNGRHVVADLPCACVSPPYKYLETNTLPEWCLGFGFILNGKYGFWAEGLPIAGVKA